MIHSKLLAPVNTYPIDAHGNAYSHWALEQLNPGWVAIDAKRVEPFDRIGFANTSAGLEVWFFNDRTEQFKTFRLPRLSGMDYLRSGISQFLYDTEEEATNSFFITKRDGRMLYESKGLLDADETKCEKRTTYFSIDTPGWTYGLGKEGERDAVQYSSVTCYCEGTRLFFGFIINGECRLLSYNRKPGTTVDRRVFPSLFFTTLKEARRDYNLWTKRLWDEAKFFKPAPPLWSHQK